MPYPRFGEAGQSGGNSGRSQSFRGAPSPWQIAEQSTGLPSGADANPLALVGNLVGAMMGRMAAGGDRGGLGALMAMQGGQQQSQGARREHWHLSNFGENGRQTQERDRDSRRRRSSERSFLGNGRGSRFRSRSRSRERRTRTRESGRRNQRSPECAEHEIYIGNYPVNFREADVRKLFRDCGVAVGAIRMKTVGLKVFAFAATDSVDEIDKAKRLMEGKEIEGRKLRVRSAKDGEKNIGKEFCGAKRRESAQKLEITREDTTKHLVQAFHDFLGRQLEGSRDDLEFRGEIESARTALAFAFSLPKDNSFKVSRKIEDTFYRETRDEISRRIKADGKRTEEEDDNANLRSKQNADVVDPGTLAKNKEVLDVKDPNWQVDEIGAAEKAGDQVEEENNENGMIY